MPPDTEAKQHEWRIEAREYARLESRRGRRFAFTRLVSARTALVVIDMVRFFELVGLRTLHSRRRL